jgi:capsule polysaccharide export protein KpsE/RkpR
MKKQNNNFAKELSLLDSTTLFIIILVTIIFVFSVMANDRNARNEKFWDVSQDAINVSQAH